MQDSLAQFLAKAIEVLERIEPWLPETVENVDWQQHWAARWVRTQRQGYLRPIAVHSQLKLADLLGIEHQQRQLVENSQQFLQGLPCNHALMWGARGTGKSSLVRAILAEYAAFGLRLIEVERSNLVDLPLIVEALRGRPERFIIFCDDLSFDAGEADFRQLKSILDGSLEQAPENVVLYVTSNRRHLLPEHQSDNQNWQRSESGELHPSEAVEDKIALSDRFGLWLSFYSFSQEHYLDVVCHWVDHYARALKLVWQRDEAFEKAAIRWATARGNRNGRCAEQFAKHWVGQLGLQR
ncbi:MAG: ATP-binding protein [Gammaproteobacteria bacterium]|nr:ATP-binding protein [Gammaproteobacteria bacterium]